MHQNSICEDTNETSPIATDEMSTIRQIARRYGVTLRALRFYEDRGLLKPHRVGAARLYDERSVTRLETILEGKRLGFTLAEIASMLTEASSDQPNRFKLDLDPEQVRNQISLLEKQREGLSLAIDELKNVHAKLSQDADVASAA
jgi:DNA-binding transcriptional MerR regulator